jgi:hypothetical protein
MNRRSIKCPTCGHVKVDQRGRDEIDRKGPMRFVTHVIERPWKVEGLMTDHEPHQTLVILECGHYASGIQNRGNWKARACPMCLIDPERRIKLPKAILDQAKEVDP